MERAPTDSRSIPELRARIVGWRPLLFVVWLTSMLGGLPGCASIERGRYGISSLEFAGMQQLRSEPLRECLLTRERHSVTLRLGASTPQCSEPPFTSADPQIRLWTWGWTAWSTFNRSVFDQDVKRIVRWYRARGFYEAEVRELAFDPPAAGQGNPCHTEPCEVRVRVVIHEGDPVLVQAVEVSGLETLPQELRDSLRKGRGQVETLRFQKRLAKLVAGSWALTTGEDLRWPETQGGKITPKVKLMQWYFGQVMELLPKSEEVFRRFQEVNHMLKSPAALFHPAVLGPVLRQAFSGKLGRRTVPQAQEAPAHGRRRSATTSTVALRH